MRKRQFTPRQSLPDIRITPQEWKPDTQVSIKYDNLYARAWDCEYEKPNFDVENAKATPPNSPETTVQSDLSTEEMWNKIKTQESVSEKFPPKRRKCVT